MSMEVTCQCGTFALNNYHVPEIRWVVYSGGFIHTVDCCPDLRLQKLAASHDRLLATAKEVAGKGGAFESDEDLIKAYAELEAAITEAENT